MSYLRPESYHKVKSIPFLKWKLDFENLASGLKNRKRLKCKAADLFSRMLNDDGINCDLRLGNNWFRKENSQKIFSPYWSGGFTCKNIACNKYFYGEIIEEPDYEKEILIHFYFNDICDHPIRKKERCSGNLRKLESLKLLAHGSTNVLAENYDHFLSCTESNIKIKFKIHKLKLYFKGHQCPPVSKSILTQIKYEAKHQLRISVDFFYDALASKYIFDNLSDYEDGVKGFIHQLHLDPFGFIMFCDFQVKIIYFFLLFGFLLL